MEQKITISVNSTYKYLQLWNGIFNLTSTELKVLGLSDFNTLNNYVKKMKDKKAIRKENKNYILNRLLDLETVKVEVNINWNE